MDDDSQFDVPLIRSRMAEMAIATRYFPELDSTNTWAIDHVQTAEIPSLVFVDHQTEGRGQRGNRWTSTTGALTFSLVIDFGQIQPQLKNLVPLSVAVACCQVLDSICGEAPFQIKWPNDLILGDRKLGGILTESIAISENVLVVGIGINVNNDIETDLQLGRNSTSLRGFFNQTFELTTILIELVRSLIHLPVQLGSEDSESVCQRFETRDWLVGSSVSVTSGQDNWMGRYEGINADGSARIESDGVLKSLYSGQLRKL